MFCLPQGVHQEELLDLIKEIGWEVSSILKSYNQNIKNSDEFQKKLKIINLESGPVTAADKEISEFIKKKIIVFPKSLEKKSPKSISINHSKKTFVTNSTRLIDDVVTLFL